MEYKLDWLGFTLSFNDDEEPLDLHILEYLGYDLKEFEKVPGRYFYNCGLSLNRYVNVFWNDYSQEVHRNSSRTMTVQFTGQGCTDLVQKHDNVTERVFKALSDYDAYVKYTRVDIALDDNANTVPFSFIESKLLKGHYRSVKRTYNIVSTSNQAQEIKAKTIYIGNPRSDNGSRGNVMGRMYDKRAQYLAKKQLPPREYRDSWQRYEIVFTKKYAEKVAKELVAGTEVGKIFNKSMRRLLELLEPSKTESNKSRWEVSKLWDDFLNEQEKADFTPPEREVTIAETLEWLRLAVLPSISMLEQFFQPHGLDIYDLLKKAQKPAGLAKKQLRMLNNAKNLDKETVDKLYDNFLKGRVVNVQNV